MERDGRIQGRQAHSSLSFVCTIYHLRKLAMRVKVPFICCFKSYLFSTVKFTLRFRLKAIAFFILRLTGDITADFDNEMEMSFSFHASVRPSA